MSDKFEVRLGDEKPIPEYTFLNGDIGSSPIGDIIAIKAKSKNGKTFLAAIFASVILGSNFGNLNTAVPDNSKVMFFDTEQNRSNTQSVLERIHIMCGWEEEHRERLRAFSLREMSIYARMDYIEKKIIDFAPTAVFIDGLADLTIDFNDIEQSQDIINRILQLSSAQNCAIFFILHTNKGDNNMKGHLGTLATQKCSDVFHIEKSEDGSVFSVTETDCRNRPIEDFAFKIDEYGIPYPTEIIKPTENEDGADNEAQPKKKKKKKKKEENI